MASVGARRRAQFESINKYALDSAALASYAAILALPGACAALGSMIDPNTRSLNPLIRQDRGGLPQIKIRTLAKYAELGKSSADSEPELDEKGCPILIVQGNSDTRASCYGRLIRKISLDETPQLVTGFMRSTFYECESFFSIRNILESEADEYRKLNPGLFDQIQDKRQEYGVLPGRISRSCIWRKGISNDTSPEARLKSMELDLEYLDEWSLVREAWTVATILPRMFAKTILPRHEYVRGMAWQSEPLRSATLDACASPGL